jgi:glycosyltransferase involved in cell wall biosynthesis
VFPARWWGAFDLLDEVWTPSTFTQEAVARSAPLPVVRVPHAVQVHLDERLGRAALGLPEQGFLFLAMCDVLSVARRKNPLGAIEAFRQAAGGMPDAHLAIKLSYGAERPAEVEELRRAAAGLPVTFIDRLFSRNEVNNLLACCDCLVSLHRSEGFGLALAEAMALGKPVLATAYSGNMDFTRPGLAFLAEYRLREVGPGAEPYDASCLWAEPDTGQAARLMGEIFSQPERRAEVAARGQQFVRRHFSPRAVGELMKRRLELIERRETRNQKA